MGSKWHLYWRWLRRSRMKIRRMIELKTPTFSRLNEATAGDNFPIFAPLSQA